MMRLRAHIMSPDVEQASNTELSNFFCEGDSMQSALQKGTYDSPDTSTGSASVQTDRFVHLVFNLTLDKIADATSLDAVTRRVGWRILTQVAGEPVASYVSEPTETRAAAMTGIQHGGRLSSSLETLLAAEKLLSDAQVSAIDAEFIVSLIHAPALYIEALWIVPTQGGQQWVITSRAMAGSLERNTVITAEAFLSECKLLSVAAHDAAARERL